MHPSAKLSVALNRSKGKSDGFCHQDHAAGDIAEAVQEGRNGRPGLGVERGRAQHGQHAFQRAIVQVVDGAFIEAAEQARPVKGISPQMIGEYQSTA